MFKLLARIAYTILTLIEALVAIRFVLLLIKANPNNELVALVLKYSEYFVKPFYGITNDVLNVGGIVFDLTSIIALVFYMVLAFVAIELVRAFSHN